MTGSKATLHQGQICMTVGRHIVHESIFDEYVEKLAAKADSMAVGNPATDHGHLGPIIDENQRDRVHRLVTASIEAGAELKAGASFDKLFYSPTVLANSPWDAPAYCEQGYPRDLPMRGTPSDLGQTP